MTPIDATEAIAQLRPSEAAVFEAWRKLVEAHEEQAVRLAPARDGADIWAPIVSVFRPAGRKGRAPIARPLEALAEPGDAWLDIGAGGGAFTVALAPLVRRVVALEPSPSMHAQLERTVAEAGVDNVTILPPSLWPPAEPVGDVDVAFASHVVYFVADIGPFVDAIEAHARRLCVAAVGDRPGSTPPDDLWSALYDEPHAQGPGLREFLAVLGARGRAFEVRTVPQPTREAPPITLDEALAMQRHKCFVEAGSERDARLRELIIEHYGNPDGSVRPESAFRHVSVVSWEPPR